ncbi:NAD(P)/FAD-dependent oxidoreductase [Dyadobacter sp. CY345]|uniref:NAD(P)/FAD-dependent oxidoreductase n=1 Tax=Dyadobacter sp. CY345 TaxID=2909335 RepID=UPI001F1BAB01|nr:NAD(P)/FAD-dependent oxidoreductase [Dyadobacter sp. CY345]MCF2443272.1 NAD(P)/FAD-dependent oxidoreductase [Dyadobacter sp. CY345]
MITTDICIIGAGPVGLFAVFEAGLLKMRCHLVDALSQVGGQLSEIYPQKPIYDIPGFPSIQAQQLIDNLMEQIAPFKPGFTLSERVDSVNKLEGGGFVVQTHDDTIIQCKVIVIAGGLGCFEPRKPVIIGLEAFEGKGISYFVKNPEIFRNRRVVLSGGGDSALDWAIFLAPITSELTLVHRGETFRGAPDSADKVVEMAHNGQIRLLLESQITEVAGNGHLQSLTISTKNNGVINLEADHLIPLFGLTPKLGPIADWGLALNKSAIEVNVDDYSTSTPGIFAIGDINSYTGKLKLILSGFHEAALMAQSAFKYVYPEQKLSFKYTTVNGVNAF